MLHNSTNVLCRGLLGSNVVERVYLISEQAKDHTRKDFKTMGEGINQALHARVVIERITVKVAELKDIPLEGRASGRCDNVGLNEGSASEGHEALKTLHEENDIFLVHVFLY